MPGDRPAPNSNATRSAVLARRGMIATSQPLASAAGLRVLQDGGNAIDAAVTAAAVLAVVEPHMNGIGGDLFAIVYDASTRKLHALNGSGRSPYAANLEAFRRDNVTEMPYGGILSVTVPGVVDGWSEVLARHGTIPLARALAPAIEYARDGFPVSEIIADQWASSAEALAGDPATAATFLPGGRAPTHGEIFSNPNLAKSLEVIAEGGRDAFYMGPIAKVIVAESEKRRGLLEAEDFADHQSNWVEPIKTNYRGYDVYEMGPNTQGPTALEILNILEGFDLRALGHNTAEYLHLLIEAKKIAWADRDAYLADPDHVRAAVLQMMISKKYAAKRRREINRKRAASSYAPGRSPNSAQTSSGRSGAIGRASRGRGDTVYLAAADGQGNVISFIQSIFGYFGSGVVAGHTGVVLQNRGSMFSLEAGHPNTLAPHKRPFHTLIPAMVLKDSAPWLAYGVMGGDMQPQGHAQVLLNLVEFGMNVQEAGEAARFRHVPGGVAIESAIDADARLGLMTRGHELIDAYDAWGGFQGVLIDRTSGVSVLMGGSDPRKDGLAIGW